MRKQHWRKLQYDLNTKEFLVPDEESGISREWKKKWIIYTRVSTEEQKRKWNWIEAQRIDCELRAKKHDVEIVWYYKDEAKKGSNLSRQWFVDAIKFLEKTNKKNFVLDYFICWATSRFSRSPEINKSFDMVARVEWTWAKLVAVWSWGIQETGTEEWLMSLTLNFLVDALESMRGKKRVRYGSVAKIYLWLRTFPAVPVGYKRVIEKEW